MKYTHVFWDFNGTILSDMQAGMDSTNRMLSDRGLPLIDGLDSYRNIFDFPIKEYYRGLGFDFEREPYEVLALIWVELYNEESKKSSLTQGVRDTLEEISNLGIPQIVFSATEKRMLTRQLEELDIGGFFDEIIGLENIHAESKTHLAKKWISAHPDARVLYVGDTVHDAENARILNADCLLFSGGHQSKSRLKKCGFPIIDSMWEMMEHLK